MIGVPTNFRHTAHISSGDIDMTIAQLADLQAQMQRKSGFDGDFSAKVRLIFFFSFLILNWITGPSKRILQSNRIS